MTVITSYEKVLEESDIDREDGCMALIADFGNDTSHMFVRLMSYDESKGHKDFRRLIGQKVRIWIEVDNGLAPLAAKDWP